MKVSGGAVVAASAAATVASCAAAISYSAPYPDSPSDSKFHTSCQKGGGSQRTGAERYAPRFDGLRFIETLVTAHR